MEMVNRAAGVPGVQAAADHERFFQGAEYFKRLLELSLGLIPLLAIAYLYYFQDPKLRFDSHGFHEVAIAVATLEGSFVSYVAWRCYLRSGEPFVKWLTLGFLGFTVVYSLHGFFTPLAHHNLWLFILYGPASRLVMGLCMFTALLKLDLAPDAAARRADPRPWWGWVGVFLAVNAGVAGLAHSPIAGQPWVRMTMENGALVLCLVSLVVLGLRRLRSPLMHHAALALAWFAASSLAFLLAKPWNHLWWLAHALFAVGFSILGYGMLRVFLATRSVERVFNVQELTEDLAQTNARLHETMGRLEEVNRVQEAQMQALEASRAQFEALFNLSPDGVLVVDAQGLVVKANGPAEALFGYGHGELDGLRIESLMPLKSKAGALEVAGSGGAPAVAGAVGPAQPCLRRDGRVFDAALSLSSLAHEGRPCTVVFVRDISDLLRAREQLVHAEPDAAAPGQGLEQLVAQAPFMALRFCRSAQGRYAFTYASAQARQLIGCAPAELLGNVNLWFSCIDPAELGVVVESIERSAATGTPWTVAWQARVLGGERHLPFSLRCGAPVAQPDGSLSWSGAMFCERDAAAPDAVPAGAAPQAGPAA